MLNFNYFNNLPYFDASKTFFVSINPRISSKEKLFESFFYQLWLPEYFGFNWDALYECLRDFHWLSQRKIVIAHEGVPALPSQDLFLYVDILNGSVADWGHGDDHQLEVWFSEKEKDLVENVFSRKGDVSSSLGEG